MISFLLEDSERRGIKIGRSEFAAQLQELSALVADLPNASEIMTRAYADPDRVDDLLAQYRR